MILFDEKYPEKVFLEMKAGGTIRSNTIPFTGDGEGVTDVFKKFKGFELYPGKWDLDVPLIGIAGDAPNSGDGYDFE